MDRLETMHLFVRIAESGSLSKAARATGVAQSTVSKQLAALEERLGVQLVRRTSRGLSLTEAGKGYRDSLLPLLDQLDAAESHIGKKESSPAGVLRVAISAGFGRMYVIPRLPEFFEQYPDLEIEFDISERYVSLTEEHIDVAIRIGKLTDSTLVAQKVGSVELGTFATSSYLERRGVPKVPLDLEKHDCVAFMFRGEARPWQFQGPKGRIAITPRGRVRSNDAEHVRAAVLAGLGLTHVPSWLFAAEIESGAVMRVLERFVPPPFPIHAVMPSRRLMPSKTRVFVEFLAKAFAADPHLRIR